MINLPFEIVLGSSSPRRVALLEMMGIAFTQNAIPIDETIAIEMPCSEQPAFLAKQKMSAFYPIPKNKLIITADTLVVYNNLAIGKPDNYQQAFEMLQLLSGNTHMVYSAICVASVNKEIVFTDSAKVTFNHLNDSEIDWYINTAKPFDKAGAYGVQDWMGACGVKQIEGSFYTVMGMPTHLLYTVLKNWKD